MGNYCSVGVGVLPTWGAEIMDQDNRVEKVLNILAEKFVEKVLNILAEKFVEKVLENWG